MTHKPFNYKQYFFNIFRSERVLDVKDNRILTAKKDGFQTHIMLGNIFSRFLFNNGFDAAKKPDTKKINYIKF